MPNLVVYVPAAVARELEAYGVSLESQREAANRALEGLLPSDLVVVRAGTGEVAEVVDTRPPRVGSVDDPHFKPDFK